MSALPIWYDRWVIFNKWKKSIAKYGEKPAYEICAIRERHSVTALCYHGSNWLSYNDFSKLISELNECKKISKNAVPEIIQGITDNIAEMCAVTTNAGEPTDHPIGKFYSYREFQPRLNRDFIVEFAKYNAFDVVELLLRYECLCPQGQQWAVPKLWLAQIRKLIGLDRIAFSSPINKNIDTDNTDVQYYSGYSEDSIFGSLGSFFNAHPTLLDSYAGRTFTMEINPPFIEDILSGAAASAESFMRYASEMANPPKVTLLYIGPDWTDADFYHRIAERLPAIQGVSVRMIKLFAGEYSYENATAGIKVTARQNSWLFTITNYSASDVTLEGFASIGEILPVAKYGGRGIRYERGDGSRRTK